MATSSRNPGHPNSGRSGNSDRYGSGEPPLDAGASARLAWGPIFAGAILALMITMLISLFLLWIGGAVFDPAGDKNPLSGMGIGTIISLVITNLIALFVGGLVTGKLANKSNNSESIMHGLLTWSLLTIASFALLTTTVGSVLSGLTSVVGQGLALAGGGVAAVAPEAAQKLKSAVGGQQLAMSDIQKEATQILNQVKDKKQVGQGQAADRAQQAAGNAQQTATEVAQSPGKAGQKIQTLVSEIFSGGKGKDLASAAGREDIVDAMVKRTSMSESEAKKAVENWGQTYQQAQQAVDTAQKQATQAAQKATEILSSAAMWSLLGLLLGAVVAAIGSIVGSPKSARQARAA